MRCAELMEGHTSVLRQEVDHSRVRNIQRLSVPWFAALASGLSSRWSADISLALGLVPAVAEMSAHIPATLWFRSHQGRTM